MSAEAFEFRYRDGDDETVWKGEPYTVYWGRPADGEPPQWCLAVYLRDGDGAKSRVFALNRLVANA